jgi:hypothetical protein
MAEKSENEASTTGQDVETPESESKVGYVERDDHVPDPTALTGTLETSGTGGGVHERLTGTTRIFGNVEDLAQRVESLINERTQNLKDEVRGLLLQQENSAVAAQIPQQSVEEHGLPTHQGNIIAPNNDTGAAQDAPRSANVGIAGSADDVSAGAEPVADPAEGDSYSQQNISGARNPQEPVEKAKQAEAETSEDGAEPKESENKDFHQAAKDYEQQLDDAVSGKAPAKKTTARRQGNAKK